MNILVIGRFHEEAFGLHIAETLESMDHKVIRFESGLKGSVPRTGVLKRWNDLKVAIYDISQRIPAIRRLEARELWLAAKEAGVDLTIVGHDHLMPTEVRELKRLTGSPVVMWFPDHIGQFQRAYFLNADYDALFFKDPYIVHVLSRALSRPIYYLPECCNPRYHRAFDLSDEDLATYRCDVTTAGNMYSYRAAFFAQLSEFDVKIWGGAPPLWLNTKNVRKMMRNRFVTNEEKSKSFKAASIVVNNLNPAEIWGINVRAFEIAGAGGFQLIDWRPGLTQLFEDGKEIVSFKSMDDLKRKILEYLADDGRRAEIAERARIRAHGEHTYVHRLERLIATVQKKARGYPMPTVTCEAMNVR